MHFFKRSSFHIHLKLVRYLNTMINKEAISIIENCIQESLNGRMTFPQVVNHLKSINVESYHADFRRQEKTYYFPDGTNHPSPLKIPAQTITQEFSATAVQDAIRAIQAGTIDYSIFLERVMAAGCIGYFVFISGKRAIYFGREGDFHVEYFPKGPIKTN
jgi:uncharacterized protein YbcV (DUF1398 family)